MSTRARQYWPALDGVRAVAIVCVVAYHLDHLGGGWIGVDIFFVLSGFLITTLLPSERASSGRIGCANSRPSGPPAPPAVLLLLVVVGVYVWAGGPGVVPAQLRDPALATLFYVANWQQIAYSHNYFAAFSAPTPLVHTWTLAIEEQYYLVWPILVVRHRRVWPPPSECGAGPLAARSPRGPRLERSSTSPRRWWCSRRSPWASRRTLSR